MRIIGLVRQSESIFDNSCELVLSHSRIAQEFVRLLCEIGHTRVTFIAIGVERVEHDIVDLLVDVFPTQRRQDELSILDGRLGFVKGFHQERILARQHLVGHRSKRPFVRPCVEVLAAHLLERHVPNRATTRRARSRRICQRRQAEVGHFHLTLCIDHDVVGLDVQVQDSAFMRRRQSAGHRVEHGGNHIERQPIGVFAHDLRERDAFDVFHDQVRSLTAHLEIEHCDDARV